MVGTVVEPPSLGWIAVGDVVGAHKSGRGNKAATEGVCELIPVLMKQ